MSKHDNSTYEKYSEDKFVNEVSEALRRTSEVNKTLAELYTTLQKEDPDDDRIEDLVWRANEQMLFANDRVRDDKGLVEQFKYVSDWEPEQRLLNLSEVEI